MRKEKITVRIFPDEIVLGNLVINQRKFSYHEIFCSFVSEEIPQ
jgi:hypothetical protein